jgi:ECF transporter S component (folate family)
MKNNNLRKIIFAGLMVATGIVLSNILSISYPPNSTIIRFGIGFLPLVIVSIVLGPKIGLYSAIVQDILGYFVYIWVFGVPSGPFFPGFTLNSILYGVVPGVVYNLRVSNKRFFGYVNYALLFFLLISGIWSIIRVEEVIALIENRLSEGMSFEPWVVYLMIGLGMLGVVSILFYLYTKRNEAEEEQRIIFSVIFLQLLVALILTPVWVSVLYKIPYLPQLPLRIIKTPVEIFFYSALLTRLIKVFKNRI